MIRDDSSIMMELKASARKAVEYEVGTSGNTFVKETKRSTGGEWKNRVLPFFRGFHILCPTKVGFDTIFGVHNHQGGIFPGKSSDSHEIFAAIPVVLVQI